MDAQVNHRDMHQRTPLFYAIETLAENLDVVVMLIEKGADINATSIDGWTPLLKSAQKKHHTILEHLLHRGANHKHVLPSSGNSALHIACEHGDLASTMCLVKAGADIQLQNKDKDTPLSIAERNVEKGKHY